MAAVGVRQGVPQPFTAARSWAAGAPACDQQLIVGAFELTAGIRSLPCDFPVGAQSSMPDILADGGDEVPPGHLELARAVADRCLGRCSLVGAVTRAAGVADGRAAAGFARGVVAEENRWGEGRPGRFGQPGVVILQVPGPAQLSGRRFGKRGFRG